MRSVPEASEADASGIARQAGSAGFMRRSARVRKSAAPDVAVGRVSQAVHGTPSWAVADWDVVVVGGGNAGVVASLAASDNGARVLLLERAPQHMRGGNSRHTRNIRCVHDATDFTTGVYTFDDLWRDLTNVGDGVNVEEIARLTVSDSATILDWMQAHGVHWQRPLAGTLHLGRTNQFFLGGGKALLNGYYREIAARPEITVVYDAMVEDFEVDGNHCHAVLVRQGDSTYRVRLRTVICASGGFEANLDWLRQYWGPAVDNYVIRGTPYNDGHILSRLYSAGAAAEGQERGFHAVAVDARSVRFDGGIATRLDSIPFGIVVNKHGLRFYDEGEDIWPKRYASWGGHIARQPDQIAYALWDAKVSNLFLPPMYKTWSAPSVDELAGLLGLDRMRVFDTVTKYNAAVVAGHFDPSLLDDCRTSGLKTEKSHWAQRLDTPPYYGIAMRPGITFTYMGVKVASDGRVMCGDDSKMDNIYAAGEIMSGNILSSGYLAGFGMTIGAVWGRRAGTAAARHVR